MPRPGPRPYECVRRAWHSDRHQPMRGSIIQQIFKVVYENHSAVTNKNKEWLEKLPLVVLKAEEIMYSKANCEAEYLATETLWNRVNDAIGTIIRKDECAETGELLPPCVEAALNLGCIPLRASRSQRHNNTRSYLNPRFQEPGSTTSTVLTGNSIEPNANHLPLHTSNRQNLERSTTGNLAALVSESNRHSMPNVNNPTASFLARKDNDSSFNLGSVYPLYYGTNFQPPLGFHEPHMSQDIIVGTPIFASFEKPAEMCFTRTLSSGVDERLPNQTKQPDFREVSTEDPEVDCDLSLRLGLFANPIFCGGKGSARVTKGIDPSNSGEVGKIKANDPSRLRDSEGEDQNVEAFLRKRKLPFHSNVDNRQIFWPIDPSQNHFYNQRKRQSS